MKIIIVDDEINAIHDFLNQIIEQNNIDYKFFYDNPSLILSYVKENEVDAAFLDINMPNINGLDLAKKIIEINNDIKIVFITGLTTTINDLESDIRNNVLGFIYKPYGIRELEKYILEIENKISVLKVNMFGSFDCFINGHLVHFSSSKSKELFAYLLVQNGKSLSMNNAISVLWPDKDLDKAKRLYRDAVWRLRSTLNEIGFNCVKFERAQLLLNKKNISCDYYDLLNNHSSNKYSGEFLRNYDWSIEYENEIDIILKENEAL